MLKFMIKIIIVVFCSIFTAGLLLQIDDKLQPQVVDFLVLSDMHRESDAYLYLLGFSSNKNEDPVLTGHVIYQDIKQQQKIITSKRTDNQYIDITQYDKLPLPSSPLLCNYQEVDCVNYIFNHIENIPSLLQRSQLLSQRYLTFSTFTDFHTMSKPDIAEPLAPYKYLIRAVRLSHLQQILLASQGQTVAAIQQLYLQHKKLRAQLVQQDILIGKLMLLGLLSENIDLIAVLANTYQLKLSNNLTSLSKEERSLAISFSREARMMHTLYQQLDGAADILNAEGELSSFVVPSWLTYILFKVNMTTNESYKSLYYFSILSELSIDRFNQEMQQQALLPTINHHGVRNAIGSILVQIADPSYVEYISDFWDVENKIQLFNAHLNNSSEAEVINELQNIYTSAVNTHPYLSKDKRQLCFDNPFNSNAKYNCLLLNH